MAAYLSRIHHISLHVSNAEKLANDLVSKFKFCLFATRQTDRSRQLAFRKAAAVFLVNERRQDSVNLDEEVPGNTSFPDQHLVQVGKCSTGKYLYDVCSHYPVDTVSNVCFEVEDVEKSFKDLRHIGCDFLVPPTIVEDEGGVVTYSVVKSIVGNVCHTLIDRSKYEGSFLPGFEVLENDSILEDKDRTCSISHFDHITYACPRKTTQQVMRWYEQLFGFRRFFIDRWGCLFVCFFIWLDEYILYVVVLISKEDVDEGYVINQDGIGLRLTAMEYWKCSELGIILPFVDKKEPDCKFVIAESLPKQGESKYFTSQDIFPI